MLHLIMSTFCRGGEWSGAEVVTIYPSCLFRLGKCLFFPLLLYSRDPMSICRERKNLFNIHTTSSRRLERRKEEAKQKSTFINPQTWLKKWKGSPEELISQRASSFTVSGRGKGGGGRRGGGGVGGMRLQGYSLSH